MFVFTETEVENYSFLQALYVFQLQVQGYTTPNRCSKKKKKKKTVPRIFLKNRQNLCDTFLLEMRKNKMGVTVLVFAQRTKPSSTVIDTVAKRPNQANTNNPVAVQFKTVASNGLAMAQSVEL